MVRGRRAGIRSGIIDADKEGYPAYSTLRYACVPGKPDSRDTVIQPMAGSPDATTDPAVRAVRQFHHTTRLEIPTSERFAAHHAQQSRRLAIARVDGEIIAGQGPRGSFKQFRRSSDVYCVLPITPLGTLLRTSRFGSPRVRALKSQCRPRCGPAKELRDGGPRFPTDVFPTEVLYGVAFARAKCEARTVGLFRCWKRRL